MVRSGNFEILLKTNPTVDYFSKVLVLKNGSTPLRKLLFSLFLEVLVIEERSKQSSNQLKFRKIRNFLQIDHQMDDRYWWRFSLKIQYKFVRNFSKNNSNCLKFGLQANWIIGIWYLLQKLQSDIQKWFIGTLFCILR